MEVSENLTKQVAYLARLELTSEEIATFSSQLQEILGYVEQLQEVDVSQIEPLNHPFELTTPLRKDEVRPSPMDSEGKPKVLQSAPETLYDGFKVPPIL